MFRRFKNFFESSEFSKGFHARLLSSKSELTSRAWDFIVLDRYRTPPEEFSFWSALGPVVGIDEGGPCRSSFDFLIDLLPSLKGHEPNLSAPGLLPLPKRRRGAAESSRAKNSGPQTLKVLISFGAEDSSGLGFLSAQALAQNPLRKNGALDITLISPSKSVSEAERNIPGVKTLGLVPKLREHLADYDLLISHFGLGAFEAVYARVPVLLVSPTAYHEKLARNAGFISVTDPRKLGKLLGQGFLRSLEAGRIKIARRYGLEGEQKEDLGSFFSGLDISSPGFCPACGEKTGARGVLARFAEESYRRCPHCGIIYLCRLNAPPIAYNEEYFSDLYKKQYGKTYIEDFPNLMEMGYRRLGIINDLFGFKNSGGEAEGRGEGPGAEDIGAELKPRLLDIGCAYGPFMAAAAESGFSPSGLDPVEGAVAYVNEELGLNAWQGYFPTGAKAEDGPFDLVTLWYVIEHFTEPGKILGEIRRILRDKGALAFSTPSFSGISGRKNLKTFLKNSPPDHWTVWSPWNCKKILEKHGFRLRKIVVTGHHPRRFPLLGPLVRPDNRGFFYRLLLFISRVFRLGDTFEVYAEKASSSRDS